MESEIRYYDTPDPESKPIPSPTTTTTLLHDPIRSILNVVNWSPTLPRADAAGNINIS